MPIVSSLLPFPPVSWFAIAVKADTIIFDRAEHFEKMSYRNRYTVGGANNVNQLSIPLVKGRDQRMPMNGVLIHNEEKWQQQHWRTLVSVYKRSPYWEYYELGLLPLFEKEFKYLIDFNLASLEWVFKNLKVKFEPQFAETYTAAYSPDVIDLRSIKPASDRNNITDYPKYYQVFEDRIGFIPNLSILDLLFSEGPGAMAYLHGFNPSAT
jgi:hypothetical protein